MDADNFDAALTAVYDPATSSADLTQIAQQYVDMRYLVAVHPNADAALLNWLDGLGDEFISQAIAMRRAGEPQPAESVAVQPEPSIQPKPTVKRAKILVPVIVGIVVVAIVAVVLWLHYAPSGRFPDHPTSQQSGTAPQMGWWARYGGTGTDEFNAVAAVSGETAGPVVVAVGYTSSTDGDFASKHQGLDGVVAEISTNNEILQSWTLGGDGDDEFYAVAVATDAAGTIYVAGDTSSTDGDFPISHGGNTDAVIVKLTWDGKVVWAKTYGGSGDDSFRGLALMPDGDVVAVGFTTSTDGDFAVTGGRQDAVLAEVTPDGNILWDGTYGDVGNDSFDAVAVNANSDIAAVGKYFTRSGGTTAFVTTIMAMGRAVETRTYGGSGDDEFHGVAWAPDGSVVAVGDTSSTDGDFTRVLGNNPGLSLLNGLAGVIVVIAQSGQLTNVTFPSYSVPYDEYASSLSSVVVTSDGTKTFAGSATLAFAGPSNGPPLGQAVVGALTLDGSVTTAVGGDGNSSFAGITDVGGAVVAVGQTNSTQGDFAASAGTSNAVVALFS
ncbi:MAG: hypothetical protein FWD80_07220 [Propionibacteriaceae bacterium]|nr:hypothetical protein [Propionibacteriaceae bacterium]